MNAVDEQLDVVDFEEEVQDAYDNMFKRVAEIQERIERRALDTALLGGARDVGKMFDEQGFRAAAAQGALMRAAEEQNSDIKPPPRPGPKRRPKKRPSRRQAVKAARRANR